MVIGHLTEFNETIYYVVYTCDHLAVVLEVEHGLKGGNDYLLQDAMHTSTCKQQSIVARCLAL